MTSYLSSLLFDFNEIIELDKEILELWYVIFETKISSIKGF
jgi:hypothetical protein